MLRGDVWGEGERIALFLHGAGKCDRSRFKELREILDKYGYTTIAFDFVGHGETGGELIGSSLKDRTDQVLAVLKHLKIEKLSHVIGLSMSGYTAVKLTEHVPIGKLVLIVSAAYRADVYETPFGDKFTGQIREHESWRTSDAYKILEDFKGEVLIIKAAKDETIPEGVIQLLYDAAKKSSHRYIYTFEHAPHKIMLYAREFPHFFGTMASLIDEDMYDRRF